MAGPAKASADIEPVALIDRASIVTPLKRAGRRFAQGVAQRPALGSKRGSLTGRTRPMPRSR